VLGRRFEARGDCRAASEQPARWLLKVDAA
jgi:hypothetical protein